MQAESPDHVLADIPDGWESEPLDRLVDMSRGISYGIVQPGSNDPSGVPIVRVNNLRGGRILADDVMRVGTALEAKFARTRLRGGEILLSLVGTLGECAVVPPELAGWNVARAVAVIPLKPNIDPKWVVMCLRSAVSQDLMRAWANTTVQATLNLRDVRRLPILLPPEPDRTNFTRAISQLDDKIEQNRRTGRALERLARAVFKAWFVDFEPVKAKGAGAAGFPGMPAAAFAALPDRFVDSELGPVPEGWAVRRLEDVMTLHYGKALSKPSRQPGQVPVYGSGGATGTHNKALVAGPGIIVGRKGSVGTLYWEDQGFFPIDTTFYVEPAAELGLHYLFEVLQTLGLETMNTDAAVPGLNRDNAYRLEVVVPSAVVSRDFEHYASCLRDLISHAATESRKLAALRDYLLPRLLSGRVRVGAGDRYDAGCAVMARRGLL